MYVLYVVYVLYVIAYLLIIIINNSICLRHISSNKTIQSRITLYKNIQISLK